MSSGGGGGGFYKYRCKYFYTHNCPTWVYVNNSACANCCAEGRDEEALDLEGLRRDYRDICVPRLSEGIFSYTLTELIEMGEVVTTD